MTMALDPNGAALALHRFGFGPRPGSIATIASDPRGAVLAELDRPNAGQVPAAGLMTSGAINRATFEFNAERQPRNAWRQGARTGSTVLCPLLRPPRLSPRAFFCGRPHHAAGGARSSTRAVLDPVPRPAGER